MLKNRRKRPVISRRVAVGRNGRPPKRLDCFEVTDAEPPGPQQAHARDDDFHAIVGEKPRRLRVFVASDHEGDWLQQAYEVRAPVPVGPKPPKGEPDNRPRHTRVVCQGDGDQAERLVDPMTGRMAATPCNANAPEHAPPGRRYRNSTPRELDEIAVMGKGGWRPRGLRQLLAVYEDRRCPWAQTGVCKPRTEMLFQLADDPRPGSLARFRSHSHATADEMASSLEAIKDVTGGLLRGVPLALVAEKRLLRHGDRQQAHTIVHLELDVETVEARRLALNTAEREAQFPEQVRELRQLQTRRTAQDLAAEQAEFGGSGQLSADYEEADYEEVES